MTSKRALSCAALACAVIQLCAGTAAAADHVTTATRPAHGAAARAHKLLAPPDRCPGQLSAAASDRAQVRAMQCLIDYARAARGAQVTVRSRPLDSSATRKARDIVRCGQFAHTACARRWDHWFGARRAVLARWGENIAWGSRSGGLATPRAVMRSWLESPGHRRNLLRSDYDSVGIGLVRGTFRGMHASIWVQHFAAHRRACAHVCG